MTDWLILAALVLVLLVLRQSVVLILAVAAAYVHSFIADNSRIEFMIQDFWFTVDREVLLSIPLFMLAGNIMSRGSIARRLIDVMRAFTAAIPGGLGVACILSCAAFAAINGSSIVTMLAIGSIMYPALVESGYDPKFALGAVASAGTLGIIVPPSIPLIVYGVVTDKNIAELFVAGIGPGLLLTLAFSAYAVFVSRNVVRSRFDWAIAAASFVNGLFALALPFLMIGGIYLGWFSPTEAAAIALAYALLIEFLIHREEHAVPCPAGASRWRRIVHYLGTREMKVRTLGEVTLETTKLLATLLPLLCIAGSLNTILNYSGVPKHLVELVAGGIQDRWLLMLGINVLLLVAGCLMDVGSALVVLAPLLQPIASAKGFDAVHFGIVMIANLEIGYLTPPVGLNLIVGMAAFRVSFARLSVAVLPFIGIMLLWLLLLTAYSPLSLALVGR